MLFGLFSALSSGVDWTAASSNNGDGTGCTAGAGMVKRTERTGLITHLFAKQTHSEVKV